MADTPVMAPKEPKQTILIAWAVAATLVAVVSTALDTFFWFRAQQHSVSQSGSNVETKDGIETARMEKQE